MIRLPNGDFIDPTYVRMVEVAEYEKDDLIEAEFADRVIIHIGYPGHTDRRVIDCVTLEEARRMRDEIAELVSLARQPGIQVAPMPVGSYCQQREVTP